MNQNISNLTFILSHIVHSNLVSLVKCLFFLILYGHRERLHSFHFLIFEIEFNNPKETVERYSINQDLNDKNLVNGVS